MSRLLLMAKCIILCLSGLGQQSEEINAEIEDMDGAPLEMVLSLSKVKKPKKVKEIVIRKGDKINVTTWTQGQVKGLVDDFAGDSLSIDGRWVQLSSVNKLKGKFYFSSKDVLILGLGVGALVGGVIMTPRAYNRLIEEIDNEDGNAFATYFVLVAGVTLVYYGAALTAGGVLQLVGANSLTLSEFKKTVTYRKILDKRQKTNP